MTGEERNLRARRLKDLKNGDKLRRRLPPEGRQALRNRRQDGFGNASPVFAGQFCLQHTALIGRQRRTQHMAQRVAAVPAADRRQLPSRAFGGAF